MGGFKLIRVEDGSRFRLRVLDRVLKAMSLEGREGLQILRRSPYEGFRKLGGGGRVLFFAFCWGEVPIIRTIVFWGLCWVEKLAYVVPCF